MKKINQKLKKTPIGVTNKFQKRIEDNLIKSYILNKTLNLNKIKLKKDSIGVCVFLFKKENFLRSKNLIK